jgi:hypothetical protein
MSDNKRQIVYALRVVVEFAEEYNKDEVLLEVTSDQPFLSIHAGDKIWPKCLIKQGMESQPKPFMYDDELTVKDVRHDIWEFSEDNKLMLNHGITVVIQDPYND